MSIPVQLFVTEEEPAHKLGVPVLVAGSEGGTGLAAGEFMLLLEFLRVVCSVCVVVVLCFFVQVRF